MTLDGIEENWDRLILRFSEGEMFLTSLVRRIPGDSFSKLVLSMHNFFRMAETDATSNKNFVLGRIQNAKMMIGVVADPEFSEMDERLDCLWRIAEQLDAVIFNGDAMLNLQGQRIMTEIGDHDILI